LKDILKNALARGTIIIVNGTLARVSQHSGWKPLDERLASRVQWLDFRQQKFWKLVSNDRLHKLKYFAQNMHSMFLAQFLP